MNPKTLFLTATIGFIFQEYMYIGHILSYEGFMDPAPSPWFVKIKTKNNFKPQNMLLPTFFFITF